MELLQIMKERYATKKFTGEQIPEEQIQQLKEMINLAPTSFGLQPFKVIVVKDEELKKQLSPASWDQPQINSCSHLFVFCGDSNVTARIDQLEKMMLDAGADEQKISGFLSMMRGFEKGLSEQKKIDWAKRQTYIALENALLGAKALGFDSCPMEGFNAEEYKKILRIPENLEPVVIAAVGKAADEPKPKIRFDDVFVEAQA